MASAKQKAAARKNIKKAQAALRKKRGGGRRKRRNPESHATRVRAGKKGARRAKERKRAKRGKRRNPSSSAMMVTGGAPRRSNPKKGRRRGKRRNPSGGVGAMLLQAGLFVGGSLVGIGLARAADMFIPLGNGGLAGVEAGAAVVLGGVTYFLSPAAAAGIAGGLGGSAGMKVLDMVVPAKSTTPAASQPGSALGQVQVIRLAPGQKIVPKGGGQAMGRVEVDMGAIEIVPDTPQQLGKVQTLRFGQRVLVGGSPNRMNQRGFG